MELVTAFSFWTFSTFITVFSETLLAKDEEELKQIYLKDFRLSAGICGIRVGTKLGNTLYFFVIGSLFGFPNGCGILD